MKNWLFVFYFLGTFTQGAAQIPNGYQIEIEKLQKELPSFKRDSLLLLAFDEQAIQFIESNNPNGALLPINAMEGIYKKYKWLRGEGFWLYRKGHFYMGKADAVEATNYFMRALKVFTKLQDIRRILMVYVFIGTNLTYNDYTDSVNLQTAIKFLQKGVDISLTTPEKTMYSKLCYSIGYAYHKMNKHGIALEYFEKSLQYNIEHKTKPRFGLCLMLTVSYNYVGNVAKFKEYFEKCEAYRPNLSIHQQYEYNYELADIYRFRGNFQLAEKYCLLMLNCAKLQNSPTKVIVADRLLYEIYKKTNNIKAALQALERLKKIEDSTLSQRSKEAITEIQLKYEAQAKQEQINQLVISQQAQNQKMLLGSLVSLLILLGYIYYNYYQLSLKNREISEAMLQGQTTERRRVAIDLHDNLGSTLSSIGWSMDAIDKSKMTKSEQKIYQNLKEMILTAYNEVRLLSHNLLPEELEKQGLVSALQSFLRKLNKNTKTHFELQIPANFNRLDKRTEFELYTITLELVNNILKHSHATHASIIFKLENQNLKLSITDNGRGLFENNSDGKGLKNVQARVESLSGKWEIKSKENEGTNSIINVPI
jgi:signal transduction histidine kinase